MSKSKVAFNFGTDKKGKMSYLYGTKGVVILDIKRYKPLRHPKKKKYSTHFCKINKSST